MRSSEYGAHVSGGRGALGIGAVARRFGLAPHVLRHWEAMGLLRPARDTVGRRRYGEAELGRVAVILRAKEAGLALGTIRALTAGADAEARRAVLRAEAEALRSRIAAAEASLGIVECALSCPHDDIAECGHFQQVVRHADAGDRG
ncbi:MerR family transcriptional regulator [Streptomyces sp. G45]|uniref:MerR family transcriptional regulator n=1 Tax=Streptomyces sp. G45 TaxID=3406627 RepID=UPI003C218E03